MASTRGRSGSDRSGWMYWGSNELGASAFNIAVGWAHVRGSSNVVFAIDAAEEALNALIR
ncbi:hypothetical protein LWC34_45325 [Kibdelosporangium philippinense]|uniref:Uncharacterized protein n=1 Tax=Kibdelosporangium philippinense TaxID=211113 RepID=A0ABS8ZQW0_9PSEU|nr:hypothetical protein [Kibdelosporangium philippinense]MCE7009982.1 hypothetical protein [Kibdelosporangium philippinense]